MINTLKLTDEELSTIQTSLQMSIGSCENFISIHGEDKLDNQTREALIMMRELHARFEKQYF